MNRQEALIQLKDLKYNFEKFVSVETTEEDVQAFDYVIKQIEKEDNKCNCCNENNHTLTVDNIKLCKSCLNILKEINL